MSTHSLPVVVVGNGPVGQTAALLLARWKVPVVILDGRPHREGVGSKAIAQQRDVLCIWDTVGIGAQLAEEGVTFEVGRTYYQDTELFSVKLQEERGESPFPPFVNVSQQRTEEQLDERIADNDLIQALWDHDVRGFEQHADGVRVLCQTESGPQVVDAAYVIASPGARADELRSNLGVTLEGETFGDRFLICDLKIDMPEWALERRFYFDPPWNPGRQVLIHACPDSTFRVDWQVPESFDLDEEERTGALDDRIRQITDGRDYEIVWKSVYRFHARVVDRMRVGRVLIAGDAAHLVAPFGARGLNSGVPDAENAAWKIAYVYHGWADEELLETYHEERRAAAVENLDVVGATMRFLVPQSDEDREYRRETLERARHDKTACAQIDSGRMSEPFWYSESSLTTADPTRTTAKRPAKGKLPEPGPGVLLPDLSISDRPGLSRLRQLARIGFTALHGPDVDLATVLHALDGVPGSVHPFGFQHLSPRLAETIGARDDEVWIVRPDAYVAAVLTDPSAQEIRAAIDRARASSARERVAEVS